MSDPKTSVVPVDLNQEWPTGRHVSGKNEDLIGFEAPTSDGQTNNEDKSADEDGNLQPDPIAPKGDPVEPDLRSYDVSPGQMHDAETTILQVMTGQIAEFEHFRDTAIARSSWIFSAGMKSNTAAALQGGVQNGNFYNGGGRTTTDQGVYAEYVDPHLQQEQIAKMQYSQFQLLQGCGGVLALVGEFVGRLNNAAQIYAGADINSTVPDGTSTA